ncbi:MAG: family 16 glycosylhydrolase [Halieaceae bacterium]
MKILLVILSLVLLQACKHPLEIEGEGDIVERLSGERGCTLEEFRAQSPRCTENDITDEDYIVSYQPVPRPGWVFSGWTGLACAADSVGDNCDFNIPQGFVDLINESFPDYVAPATTAVFIPEDAEVTQLFEETIAGPILDTYCLSCHSSGGPADETRLVFEAQSSARQDIDNITVFGRFLDTVAEGREYILNTVSDSSAHNGVSTFSEGSSEYADLDSFLRVLESGGLYDGGADAEFSKDFALANNWAGRKTLNFSYNGTGSGETVTVQIKTNRPPDPGVDGWVLAWSEEFDEPAGTLPNPDIWTPEIGDGTNNGIPGWGNDELQYYTGEADNAATDGEGNLVITVREADGSLSCYYGSCQYTSARLITANQAEFAYGRIESRIKVPTGAGLWPAFWSLGTDIGQVGWPRTGEIDFMEYVGREPNEVFGTIHGPGYSASQSFGDDYQFSEPVANDYRSFAVEWEPDVIRWYVDDILYHTATPADVSPNDWVFNDEVFLILNVAIGGNFGGPVDPNIQLPAETLVDYVRVYGAPDTGELFETSFVDDVSGWREVELPIDNLTRSAEQPDGAPNDGYSWSVIWGYNFVLPRGGSVLLNEVEVRF